MLSHIVLPLSIEGFTSYLVGFCNVVRCAGRLGSTSAQSTLCANNANINSPYPARSTPMGSCHTVGRVWGSSMSTLGATGGRFVPSHPDSLQVEQKVLALGVLLLTHGCYRGGHLPNPARALAPGFGPSNPMGSCHTVGRVWGCSMRTMGGYRRSIRSVSPRQPSCQACWGQRTWRQSV